MRSSLVRISDSWEIHMPKRVLAVVILAISLVLAWSALAAPDAPVVASQDTATVEAPAAVNLTPNQLDLPWLQPEALTSTVPEADSLAPSMDVVFQAGVCGNELCVPGFNTCSCGRHCVGWGICSY